MQYNCTSGKIEVSRQRFFCDLCDSFDIIVSREHERQGKGKKQRTNIEAVIRERNSKIKELLSNIEMLAGYLQCEDWQSVLDRINIEKEKDCC